MINNKAQIGNMNDQLIQEIANELAESSKQDFINGAKWQAERDRWKTVAEETPPTQVELLVKNPEGFVSISYFRKSYGIFDCQEKYADSFDWEWKLIK